ncbi:MAG TPA: hypothetical protein VKH19_07135 [Gemmatimonadaceae bacterium]|nr:hypothetical protein [Gemmatimonadaceae bacterium]
MIHTRARAFVLVVSIALVTAPAGAQQTDTTRAAARRDSTMRRDSTARRDTTARRDSTSRSDTLARRVIPIPSVDTAGPRPEIKPPLSPRRAFLYSLLVPGYAQSVLGRNRAGALEMTFEAVALAMVRISAADVHEARRMRADSIPVSFVDATGAPRIRYEPTIYTEGLIRSRRAHLEDWIAVLIGNHLFSGADAFVAANLWDLPAEVSASASRTSARVAFTVLW